MTEQRKFGYLVGGMLTVLGALLLLWRHRTLSGWSFIVPGLVLILLALVHPAWLAVPNRLWLRFAGVLGRFNTWLFMSLIFFLVLSPLGIFFRIIRRDTLRRRRSPGASGTMWVDYPPRVAEASHFERMF